MTAADLRSYVARFNGFLRKNGLPKWVAEAVKRHRSDIARKAYTWSPAHGARVCKFLELITQTKSQWAGETLRLADWQVFLVMSVFGWRMKDNIKMRRFRTAVVSVPRKNGKSSLIAGISLWLTAEEAGAEVYCIAMDKEQAKAVWDQAKDYVQQSQLFEGGEWKTTRDYIEYEVSKGKLEPLHADANRLDGRNPSGVVLDEIYSYPTDELYNVMKSGTASRLNPLFLMIGSKTELITSFGHKFEESVKQTFNDRDDIFALFYEPDAKDNFDSETTWEKVNPNWGVSVIPSSFRELYKDAKMSQSKWINFLTKNLNFKTTAQVDSWIDTRKMKFINIELEDFRGEQVIITADLALKGDLTGLSFLFPAKKPKVKQFFFIPALTLSEKAKEIPLYLDWVKTGDIILVPGDTLDDEFLYEFIANTLKEYDLKPVEATFDRWKARRIMDTLEEDGITVVDFPQHRKFMSPAIRDLEEAILTGVILFGKNEVTEFCFHNAKLKLDDNNNPMVVKNNKSSKYKIDGVITALMAYSRFRALFTYEGEPIQVPGSKYELSDLLVLG